MSKQLNSQQRTQADYEYNKAKLKRVEAQIEELKREAVLIKDNMEYLIETEHLFSE